MQQSNVTAENILCQKNAISPLGFDPGTTLSISQLIYSRYLLKQSAEGGYQPTMYVPVTFDRGVLLLHHIMYNHKKNTHKISFSAFLNRGQNNARTKYLFIYDVTASRSLNFIYSKIQFINSSPGIIYNFVYDNNQLIFTSSDSN